MIFGVITQHRSRTRTPLRRGSFSQVSPIQATGQILHAWWALALTLVIITTVAIYWAGLHGPLLLDDTISLDPVSSWLNGQFDWRYVVFSNHTGPLGRPVSMATFVLDAALTHAVSGAAFKPTNLLIHVFCGLAMVCLGTQVLRRWTPTTAHARWVALAFGTAWLWLPLNVDTVLYTVQRMAQLAALFVLLALCSYMAARTRMEQGRRSGPWLLWLGVPALTMLAAFSKENGVLALPLALVLELFLFPASAGSRPRGVKLFFAITVGLPALAAIAFLAIHPGYIATGYIRRDFTLEQRLLTEPRVLWSYVQTLLVPVGPRMGFFQDNFPVSTGMFQPWTTLPAIIAWVAVAVAGWRWRHRNPLFGAGVFFFLVGQSMESSVIPLEIYFEHRNYLPSFGILLAVIATLAWGWQKIMTPTRAFRTASISLVVCALVMYAGATWSHVQSWRNYQAFFHAQGVFNPTSPRFQSYLISIAISNHDLPAALTHIAAAERHAPPDLLPAVTLARFHAYCSAGKAPPVALYEEFATRARGPITIAAKHTMDLVADDAIGRCPGLRDADLVAIIRRWLATTPTSARSQTVWQTRYNLARVFIAHGALQEARGELNQAWVDSAHDSVIGILLFQVNGSLGDVPACREVLAQLEQHQGNGDHQLDRAITVFRKALSDGTIHVRPDVPSKVPSKG